MSIRNSARRELNADGHQVMFDNSDDTGMAFSATNWRYWLLGVAACFALAGIVMAMLTSHAPPGKSEEYQIGYTIGSGIFGLLCTGVVPGIFLLSAIAASSDRTKRGCFLVCVISALGLSTVYCLFAGLALAVNGTASSRRANEAAYKQAFETLDSYAASADRARDAFFNAGGTRVKTLIGADTIRARIALVNKLKTECAASTKLLESAETALDEWFAKAGVSSFARDEFWEERYGHEYVEALKNLRLAETSLTAGVSEYLGVMRSLDGHFAMADSDNVYFKDAEDLDKFNAALKKLEPSLKAYESAQDRLEVCKAKIKKQQQGNK